MEPFSLRRLTLRDLLTALWEGAVFWLTIALIFFLFYAVGPVVVGLDTLHPTAALP
jgi:hypothetical protein